MNSYGVAILNDITKVRTPSKIAAVTENRKLLN